MAIQRGQHRAAGVPHSLHETPTYRRLICRSANRDCSLIQCATGRRARVALSYNSPMRSAVYCLALVFLLDLSAACAAAEDPVPFAAVRGLLAAKCLACHGNDAKDLKGDFDLRTRASAIKGGESGAAAIVPGEPDKSPL